MILLDCFFNGFCCCCCFSLKQPLRKAQSRCFGAQHPLSVTCSCWKPSMLQCELSTFPLPSPSQHPPQSLVMKYHVHMPVSVVPLPFSKVAYAPHTLFSEVPCLSTSVRKGTLYLRAAVHWRGQHPPKGLGTNMTAEATQHPSTHVNMRCIHPR